MRMRMGRRIACAAATALAACTSAPRYTHTSLSEDDITRLTRNACPPLGWGRARLDALKADGFEIVDAQERQTLAKSITACLGSPDPALRDGIAYEALVTLLRERQLDADTMRALLVDLTARLTSREPLGVEQPFAALALSEVARADRVETFLADAERTKLLVDAQHWFINIRDYRGFRDGEGWRHAVAHGSDLLMQLALNPKIDGEGVRLIVAAIGVQVAPEGHAYIHGESERLARAILFASHRGAMDEAGWTAWLEAVATPKNADTVYASEAGLAWRHNTLSFLRALYIEVVVGPYPEDDVLHPGLEAALEAMP